MNTRFLSKPKKSFWDSKKVLITGHTGFKGSWLSLWLLQMNAQVSGISLKPENPNNLFDQLKIEKDLNHITYQKHIIFYHSTSNKLFFL